MMMRPPGFGQQQPMTQPQQHSMSGISGGFGQPPRALSTAVQQGMSGMGGQMTKPGMGGQPPMAQPQKPVYDPRAYLNAVQQYKQSGSQGRQPLYTDFQQQPGMGGQPPMPPQLGGMGGQLGGMDRIKQLMGGMGGQMAPGQMNPAIQGINSYPAPQQGGFGQPQMVPQQGMGTAITDLFGGGMGGGMGGQPNMFTPMVNPGRPQQGGYGPGVNNYSAPQRQPMAHQIKPANPMMPQGMNMGGSVGMAPPNPYSQQVGQEDPRMQAMRNMQMMNFGG